jgi:hypothetical protein
LAGFCGAVKNLAIAFLTVAAVFVICTSFAQNDVFHFTACKLASVIVAGQQAGAFGMEFGGFPSAWTVFVAFTAMFFGIISAESIAEIFVDFAVTVVILAVADFDSQIGGTAFTPCINAIGIFAAFLASLTDIGACGDNTVAHHVEFCFIA